MSATTGFEDRMDDPGVQNDWTTLAEEASFLSVLSENERVNLSVAGQSVEGNDILLVEVTIPGGINIESRPVVLIIAEQHGWEVAGREASFWFMRYLVETQEPAVVDYLSKVRWVFLPTANPDRLRIWSDGQRNNANNVDINRDHISLDEPETIVMWDVINKYRPDILVDAHEARNISAGVAMEYNNGSFREAPTILNNLSRDAIDNYIKDMLEKEGITVGDYTVTEIPALTNVCELFYCLSILFETRRENDPDVPLRKTRTEYQYLSLQGLLDFHMEKWEEVRNAKKAAIREKIIEGRTISPGLMLEGTTTINPPPAGYSLSSAQWSNVQRQRNKRRIRAVLDGNSYIISMARPFKPIIGYIVDPSADNNVISATRLASLPAVDQPIKRWSGGEWNTVTQKRQFNQSWSDTESMSVSKIQE